MQLLFENMVDICIKCGIRSLDLLFVALMKFAHWAELRLYRLATTEIRSVEMTASVPEAHVVIHSKYR